MAKWGEIKCREAASKCPRCEELSNCVAVLEAKLAKAEDFVRRLERFAVLYNYIFLADKAQEALAELTSSEAATKEGGKDD